ncbi:lactate/malate family dehydrogenase [Cutibacterium avidum]|uniref:lactate/malate family dehydrogenase n=1 Tax=Cutibacterium avidum TaxID=33010 RepID=UPI0008F5D47C|nr:L-lactate dehydrogenase [Cutibacterium avidum]MDK7698247.1 L-lactate dehydrogenase [Cutibacterium avidum]OIJ76462.1 L-lactate dehydrogenase [Cutibacterium avidum]
MSIKPHKLGIIGVGRVGEAVLFDAMASGLFGRIVLIDIKEGLPEGQALDQHHATAVPNMPNTTVIAGDHDDLTDADVIVIAAGPSIDPAKGPATGADRRELAATNGRIIREIMTEITKRNHDVAVIICSNPLDANVHIATTEFDHPQGLVMGTGTLLDSARMCRLIADHVGVNPEFVRGYMIGEHGPSGFPLISGVNVGGVSFDDLPQVFGVTPLDPDDIATRTNNAGTDVFNLKGWTNAGVGQAAMTIARAIVRDERSLYPVCTTLHGQYGHDGDVSMSTPCIIGAHGVEQIIEVPLSEWEQGHLATTVKAIQDTVAIAS